MTELLRRLHIWVGLFNLTVLIVFAITGIHATLLPAPMERKEEAPDARTIDYEAPADFTDQQVAGDLYAKLAIPLVGPIPDWAISRNEQNILVLEFHGPNGVHRATVLEEQKQVRIEHARTSLGEFMNRMHANTLFQSSPDLRIKLWALYVDISIFSLSFMAATGIWLWLSSRPKLWWARASFGIGSALFVLLWWVAR